MTYVESKPYRDIKLILPSDIELARVDILYNLRNHTREPKDFTSPYREYLLKVKKNLFNEFLFVDVDGCLVYGVFKEHRFPDFTQKEMEELKKLNDGHRKIVLFSNRSHADVAMLARAIGSEFFLAEAGNIAGINTGGDFSRIELFEGFDIKHLWAKNHIIKYFDEMFKDKLTMYDTMSYVCVYPTPNKGNGIDLERLARSCKYVFSQYSIDGKPLVSADKNKPNGGFYSISYDSAVNFIPTDKRYKPDKVKGIKTLLMDTNISRALNRADTIAFTIDDLNNKWQEELEGRLRSHHTFPTSVSGAAREVIEHAKSTPNGYVAKEPEFPGLLKAIEDQEVRLADAFVRFYS